MGKTTRKQLDEAALERARLAVEDVLVDLRDRRISVANRGNGFVAREADGEPSSVMRLSTLEGLRIGIAAYLDAVAGGDDA